MKYALATFVYLTVPALAHAVNPCNAGAGQAGPCPVSPTPGPLLGDVAGPWLLVAALAVYGAYRLYKRAH